MILTFLHFRAGFKPFMEYAGSYALFNYRLQDPALGLEYSNLRLIRAFGIFYPSISFSFAHPPPGLGAFPY